MDEKLALISHLVLPFDIHAQAYKLNPLEEFVLRTESKEKHDESMISNNSRQPNTHGNGLYQEVNPMRKQYHFRKSDQGLLAWDIDNLVSLTTYLEAIELPLSNIRELDEPYWYDLEGDTPTCKSIANHIRLIQYADLSHPIIVCPEGRVMDGMHRVVKAYLEGRKIVLAYRLPVLPPPDFVDVDPDDLPYDET